MAIQNTYHDGAPMQYAIYVKSKDHYGIVTHGKLGYTPAPEIDSPRLQDEFNDFTTNECVKAASICSMCDTWDKFDNMVETFMARGV